MPKSLMDAYRSYVHRRREQVAHDRCMADHRFASEHRIHIARSLERTGEGCPFCR
jgi:hypothetical protein